MQGTLSANSAPVKGSRGNLRTCANLWHKRTSPSEVTTGATRQGVPARAASRRIALCAPVCGWVGLRPGFLLLNSLRRLLEPLKSLSAPLNTAVGLAQGKLMPQREDGSRACPPDGSGALKGAYARVKRAATDPSRGASGVESMPRQSDVQRHKPCTGITRAPGPGCESHPLRPVDGLRTD